MSTVSMTKEEQIRFIEATILKEKGRLFNFIKKRVPSNEDAEDIMQDVLLQFVKTYDNIGAIDKVTSWLFTVARNKITDNFRKKKPIPMSEKHFHTAHSNDEEKLFLEDLLSDLSGGPEDEFLRNLIWNTLEEALKELPQEQRDIFIWHELEKKSFKEFSKASGVSVNTLLSRKRYAIMFLRKKLANVYDELQG